MDQLLIKQLKGPPFIRLPVENYIKCAKLMKMNNEAVEVLKTCMSDDSSLWTEIGILEKAIYQMKYQWRLEPLYRGTKQVLKCMLRLKSERILDTILTALDSVLGLDGKTLVPSRQYLEYLLVKIIGVGRLAVQAIDYCVYVQTKLMGKLEIGHVLNSVMAFTSFVSRIWVLCHTLLVQIQQCYHCIYSLHLLSSPADYQWLPEDVTLPDRFPIDVESIIERSSCQKVDSPRGASGATPDLTELRTQAPGQLPKDVALEPSQQFEDVGVCISRESFKSSVAQFRRDLEQPDLSTAISGSPVSVDVLHTAQKAAGDGQRVKKVKRKKRKAPVCDADENTKVVQVDTTSKEDRPRSEGVRCIKTAKRKRKKASVDQDCSTLSSTAVISKKGKTAKGDKSLNKDVANISNPVIKVKKRKKKLKKQKLTPSTGLA